MPRNNNRRSYNNRRSRKRKRCPSETRSPKRRKSNGSNASNEPREYLSTDPYVLKHPQIVPLVRALKTVVPSAERPRWSLNNPKWAEYLRDYPHPEYVKKVLARNINGWPTTSNQNWDCAGVRNEYKATLEQIISGLTKIKRRVDSHYLWGPFLDLKSTPFSLTDIAVWPHFYKHEINKIRMLINMSCRAFGLSLNDHMSDEDKYVQYITVLKIIRRIVTCGLKYLWAMDAFEAYCRVPLEERMIPLLGIRMCNMYFFYTCLVMGYSPSSRVYNEFGDVVQWMCVHRDTSLYQKRVNDTLYDLVMHYLDGLFSLPTLLSHLSNTHFLRLSRRSLGL